MQNKLNQYCKCIIDAIENNEINNKEDLNRYKLLIGKKLGIANIPSNPDILTRVKKRTPKINQILLIKPLRTLSGVAPIAIMTKPIKCPHGTCLYCPGGPESVFGNVPQSYTGNEPATMRAINNSFDAYLQTMNRISQYYLIAHNPEKLELIIMGGTFPSFSKKYQTQFITEAFMAVNDFSELFFKNKKFDSEKFNTFFSKEEKAFSEKIKQKLLKMKKETTLLKEQKMNETSKIRIVTMCIETRPDWSKEPQINDMLTLGTTRTEIGVQSIYNKVLNSVNRGHTVEDSIEATRLLKDSGLKITYHMMPGLPKTTKEEDIFTFKELYENPNFRPDGLKIYPCMVMPGTGLEKLYKQGKFSPLTTEEAAEIIAEGKRYFPKYTRIHRVQRDIPTKFSFEGIQKNNLRQIVEKKLKTKKITCKCIRCMESGINFEKGKHIDYSELKISELPYSASKGEEMFISFEDKKNKVLAGFCRLRKPFKPFRKEFTKNTCVIRELHVFGSEIGLGKTNIKSQQHRGFGKQLIERAEQIALEKFDAKKLLVISGVGAREYYSKKLRYKQDGVYMSKKL